MPMFDPYARTAVPKEVEATVSALTMALASPRSMPQLEAMIDAPQPPALDRWDVVTHIYRGEAEANVGFLGKIFSAKGKAAKGGVTQEAKQYRLGDIEGGKEAHVGVAVRLAVATSSAELEAGLTIPNLAAAAQLSMAETRIGIYVLGFRGPLGDIMPAPNDLDVENFSGFMAAFAEIQKRVFSMDNASFLSPTLLGYFDPDEAMSPV